MNLWTSRISDFFTHFSSPISLQPAQRVLAVNVILEDLFMFNPSKDEMMKATRHVDARLSEHGGRVEEISFVVNL
jgi:hypothetical protein